MYEWKKDLLKNRQQVKSSQLIIITIWVHRCQLVVCGTVFHRKSLLHPLSLFSAIVLNYFLAFFIQFSDSSLTCTRHFGH